MGYLLYTFGDDIFQFMHQKQQYTEYFDELKDRIVAKKLHLPSPIYGSINIIVVIFFYVWGLFLLGKIPLLATILFFYVIIVELGYISHDLIHNQYFKNRKINLFLSYITANFFIGLSRWWWAKKHNNDHHNFTNSDIHDSDIRDYDEIFTKNPGKSQLFHKYKRVLFWCATAVLYFNLIFLSYRYIFQNRKYAEWVLNFWNTLLLPGFLMVQFWVVTGLMALVSIYILVGVHLALVFMVNHIGMEIIDGKRVREYAWFDLQTRTSRNIQGGMVINHIFWGLNKQIEHHLFPHVSRWNIMRVGQEVRSFCKEKGIRYHDVSFRKAISEIWNTLTTGKTV